MVYQEPYVMIYSTIFLLASLVLNYMEAMHSPHTLLDMHVIIIISGLMIYIVLELRQQSIYALKHS